MNYVILFVGEVRSMNDFQKYLDEHLDLIEMEPDEGISIAPLVYYDIYQEIRNAIISVRRESHMTQKELAERTGLTQANISNMEKGRSKPTIESLKKIADATGTRLVVDFLGQEIV
jgi:DNA-binding XRE family transcriptional regulator